MTERRIGLLALIGLGAIVAFLLVAGAIASPRAEAEPITVQAALAGGLPDERWGSRELYVAGWYAELDGDCVGDDGGSDASVAWLQRECPLRVLLPEQPSESVTQEELLRTGLLLAAPLGNAFPSRATPDGPNLRGQQLVFVGHFSDPAASSCVPERATRCRRTFVVSDYDELVR